MKRKTHLTGRSLLAATALAVCGTSVHAQSNVTLYGIVAEDIVHASNVVSGGNYRMENGRLNPSRLGFKGSEDLGGGLSAIFDLESGINPDTGTANAPFWNRGTYVGLKGGFGSLTFGRHWNVNDDLLGNFFIFGGYAVFSYGGFGATSDLFNNSAKYVSPSFSGFSVEALGALGEGGPRTGELAGMYDGGAFKAALTYHMTEIKNGAKDKLVAGGVSYGMKGWNGRLAYAVIDNQLSGSGTAGFPKASSFDVGVDVPLGAAASASLDYVTRDLKDSSDDSAFFRVLLKYNLSKRTQLNANLIMLDNKGSATQSFYGINAPGEKQIVVGAGVSHAF